MSYLLVQILICLLIAGLIGGIIGWFLRGGCKNKLRENNEYWESKIKSSTSSWETKVQGLMVDKEEYRKNSENKFLSIQEKISFFEKQNKDLTIKHTELLLNEEKLMDEAKEKLAIQNSTWETKVNTLWSSKENLKSKALTLMTSYENLKLKFLEKNEVHEKLQGDFALLQRKSEEDKNKIAFFETQNIELDKKLTEDTLISQINNLKDEKKD